MKSLYTAATGMAAQQMRIENISNNLANVSTVGFKKSRESFEDLLYQNLPTTCVGEGATRANNLQTGSGVRLSSLNKDFQMGDVINTSGNYDLAIAGRGFFVVESPDGTENFTRNGQFGVNAEGELVTQAGHIVSPGVEIPRDATTILVGEDGAVTAVYQDSAEPVVLGYLRVVDFMNPSGLRAMGGNLFTQTPESGQAMIMEARDGLRIKQGFLESSNVDVAEELVSMIVAQRSFEISDQMMQTINGLKR